MTDDSETVLTDVDARGVARVILNRPEIHNAIDDALIARLTGIFTQLDGDSDVRAVLLSASGKSFSAGADFKWMQRTAGYSEAENVADAEKLGELLRVMSGLSKPTLALVQGGAYGGGVGLACCCDIVIASEDARFSLSEVRIGLIPATISPYVVRAMGVRQARRYMLTGETIGAGEAQSLGLIPATISPYVVRAMGERQARRYMLTGETIGAGEAQRLGLVHEVVAADDLEAAGEDMIDVLFEGGPGAQAAIKRLVARVADGPVDSEMIADTARRIAESRATDEAKEGIAAFFAKRGPAWRGE